MVAFHNYVGLLVSRGTTGDGQKMSNYLHVLDMWIHPCLLKGVKFHTTKTELFRTDFSDSDLWLVTLFRKESLRKE